MQQSVAMQNAVLGGGCFWCLDALFRQLVGVSSVESGYAGGLIHRVRVEVGVRRANRPR